MLHDCKYAQIMRALFRVDASAGMGAGHFMRCLNLGLALKKRGHDIAFAYVKLPRALSSLLVANSIPSFKLAINTTGKRATEYSIYDQWLSGSQSDDARAFLSVSKETRPDCVIVDHYALDSVWENLVRGHTEKVLVIDDLANREHSCDFLLDQNFHTDMVSRYRSFVNPETRLLLGPKFALLGEGFRIERASLCERDGKVRNILIFFGGGDPENCTEMVLKVLECMPLNGVAVTVLVGDQHPAIASLEKRCKERGYKFLIQSEDVPRLMSKAHLCIGAAGVSTWERCCLGLPTLAITIADNQVPIAQAAAVKGAICYLGEQRKVTSISLERTLRKMMSSPDNLMKMSRVAMALVDGNGTERISEIIS